ncbi:MAG: polymer-forming cytoskeletal protein [Alphaproteobacteria bacterium]|nr:polymer-forming cytoskeletal protein [Alphaproteobacteria bacterium]
MKKIRRTIYLKIARFLGRGRGANSVPTIIAENTNIKGNIISSGTLHVDGTVEGDVTCDELIIGVKGSVTGTIKAQSMYLYGTLNGQALVESLSIAQTARLMGDARHKTIAIEPGAFIEGRCIRSKPELSVVESKTLTKAKIAE